MIEVRMIDVWMMDDNCGGGSDTEIITILVVFFDKFKYVVLFQDAIAIGVQILELLLWCLIAERKERRCCLIKARHCDC